MDRSGWNDRYRASTVWSGRPNATLVALLSGLPAGHTALDLACGEGADALWLASRGWDVVAVDWAGVALDRARAAARQAGLTLRFVEGDITDAHLLRSLVPGDDPTAGFDLVSVAFLHPEPRDRPSHYAHLPGLLAPGGRLVVVAHDPSHAAAGLGGPPPHRMLAPQDILAALDLPTGLHVAVAEVRPRRRDAEVVALDSVVLVQRTD